MGKIFKFDVVIDAEDMCNRVREKKRLVALIRKQGRIVIYSLRRMGKTSLVNVCSQLLKKTDPKIFGLYVDLNEVTSLGDVAGRFKSHYETALNEQLPLKNVKAHLDALVSRLKLGLPGGVEISLKKKPEPQPEAYIMSLFKELKTMGQHHEIVIILDEFQGIAALRDVQAVLRREIKKLSNAAVILMGSNQRLLYKMFNDKKSPFFGFGEDMELKPIPLDEYLPYMNERFAVANLSIDGDTADYLMRKMNGIPNYINELGSWIVDTIATGTVLTKECIDSALADASKSKQGRYESALYGYSVNQKKFIKAVARLGLVSSYTGQEMSGETGLSPTELNRIGMSLDDAPIISRDTKNRFFILDPFLKQFLEML
ncbi:MAG: ATP-binding protein [Deltaproteobacteria bacterium]|nr:ATP-binding protein [Deltaproteobacteria bacterium]